ncbi:hypothetical protein [Solimonas sp. SE-A11]|uniref:hypothetical protein n=1 Tax=Solimonas sp. SE-A11 TaxID=3054954 RepID=UPI00259CDEAB|nr:hypothetical protein [Solimonas sp. SE-A11]MDM4768632.1 hypothetical protein [Solimonas sp. SE-A11]
MSTGNEQFAKDVGEIKGTLQGIRELLAAQNESINRRMDDQHAANTRRLDDLNLAVGQRLDEQGNHIKSVKNTADLALERANQAHEKIEGLKGQSHKSSAVVGGSASAVVAVGWEFLKRVVGIP